MRKIKSFVNKLKDKYYRTNETVCEDDRTMPVDTMTDPLYNYMCWGDNQGFNISSKFKFNNTYYPVFKDQGGSGSWDVVRNATMSEDEIYGRYDGLTSRRKYIRDKNHNEIHKYTYQDGTDGSISSFKDHLVKHKQVYDTIDKYTTPITEEQLEKIRQQAISPQGNQYIIETFTPLDYISFDGNSVMFKDPNYTMTFSESDSEESISNMKKWVYCIKNPNALGTKYRMFGWGDNMGNTSDSNITTVFDKVLKELDLLPKFLPKNLYTFTSDRYNPTQSARFYQYSTVLDDVLSSKNTGVLHKASNLNISKILYNPLMASGFGFSDIPGIPAFAEANNQLASQEGYMGGISHDILKKFLLKNGNLEDSYYIINKNIVNEYPRAAEVLAKLMSLSEEELAPIINDPFRKATASDILYTNVDEEEFKKSKAFRENKVRKYHVLDLAMRKVPGYEIEDLSYLTDEFLQAHQDCRAVFLRNSRYCYVPKDAETYALSNVEYNKLINPHLVDANDPTPII